MNQAPGTKYGTGTGKRKPSNRNREPEAFNRELSPSEVLAKDVSTGYPQFFLEIE